MFPTDSDSAVSQDTHTRATKPRMGRPTSVLKPRSARPAGRLAPRADFHDLRARCERIRPV